MLAGSAAHVISGVPAEKILLGYSYLPYLAKALLRQLEDYEKQDSEDERLTRELFGEMFMWGTPDHELADVVERLERESVGPALEVEFCAKKLFLGQSLYGSVCMILSPLYVSMA